MNLRQHSNNSSSTSTRSTTVRQSAAAVIGGGGDRSSSNCSDNATTSSSSASKSGSGGGGNLKLISNPLHPDVSPTTTWEAAAGPGSSRQGMTAFDHTYQTIGDVFQQQQHPQVRRYFKLIT